MVAPHPRGESSEVGESRVGVDVPRCAHHVAVDAVCVGPVGLGRHRREAQLVDQAAGDPGPLPVELVGPVRCLADEDEAPVADPVEQRVVVVPGAEHGIRRPGERLIDDCRHTRNVPSLQATGSGAVVPTVRAGRPSSPGHPPSQHGGGRRGSETQVTEPLIVEATAVQKTYDTGVVRVDALQGVDLAVTAGEMVAIMGPSGCGKTTLLNCLSGLDAIDGGDVRIEGRSLASMSDRERTDYRARRMGFVFQFYNLMPVLSAVENVELPLLVARVPMHDARGRALDALALVGLAERAAHQPDELSGGERQRVTIARALVNDPAIVWADEPTGDLDSEMADEIVSLMRTLNRDRGFTFIVVTHDISVGRRTDRIVRMLDGRVVEEQRLEESHARAGHAA